VDTLERARCDYWEDPAGSLETAIRLLEAGRATGDAELQSRALSLQGAISLHRGDVHGAFALAAEAERHAGESPAARIELAALNAHLHFFSGAYAESLRQAELGVVLADRHGEPGLRIHARRMGCVAFGNVGVDDWPERLQLLLELTEAAGSAWEQSIAHNDLAHLRMAEGDLAAAEAHMRRGLELAHSLAPRNRFALGVLHCTRAEMRLRAGAPDAALADAVRATEHLTCSPEVNPYLLAMTVLMEVEALLALGRVDDARRAGDVALERLGDRVPQARAMVLSAVAEALRAAGRHEEAYDALARGAALEREALREFSELLLGLERARIEMAALREQADRDPLTGVRNRRYLDRARAGAADALTGPVSLAIVDLDHFKSINDSFGHHTGDAVLVRAAELLVDHVRAEDIVIRTGGEEFAVLMPACDARRAAAVCERLRAVIHRERWDALARGLAVTASIGVVSAPDATGLDELGRRADERLYAAKRAGRNRVAA
jgi:diguanylate cyclase (GGDEF)-like protein